MNRLFVPAGLACLLALPSVASAQTPVTGNDAETKSPTYPEFTDRGSLGLPWYSDGASLSVPVRWGDGLTGTSASLRKVVIPRRVVVAGETSELSLYGSEGATAIPLRVRATGLAMRASLGSMTDDRDSLVQACEDAGLAGLPDVSGCDTFVKEGGSIVPLGWSLSLGLRAGAVENDPRTQFAAVEVLYEYAFEEGAGFAAVTMEHVTDARTKESERPVGGPIVEFYGATSYRVTMGGRLRHLTSRAGFLGYYAHRRWRFGPDDVSEGTFEFMVFGALKEMRVGIGASRAVGAEPMKVAGDIGSTTQFTVWLSPGT